MSFTYAQMKTAIQDYTQNTETSFVTNLAYFYPFLGGTHPEDGAIKPV